MRRAAVNHKINKNQKNPTKKKGQRNPGPKPRDKKPKKEGQGPPQSFPQGLKDPQETLKFPKKKRG